MGMMPETTNAARGETVLVVDDSRAQRMLMTRTLERWGYGVVQATSGTEALEACKDRHIGLIVSDWMMPGMSGLEFCRAWRALMEGRPGYFILLTAQTEREALAEGLESGADDFLSKPVSSIELRARLRAGERILNAQRALAEKNGELSQALDQLSDAYSAIDRDLREARKFQEGLVPDQHNVIEGAEISLLYRSSGHVGGDMVGYFPVREGEVGLFSVDVSGHGVSSALMTARIAGFFSNASPERNIALVSDTDGYRMLPPDEVCTRLNALLQKDADSDLYLTMVLAHVATGTGEVTLCQAGHPSPLVLDADGGHRFLESYGTPIGLIEEVDLEVTQFRLGRSDRLLLYSDGITECPDPDGALFDEAGLVGFLEGQGGKAGPAMLDALVDRLETHAGRSDFPDDLSAVLVGLS